MKKDFVESREFKKLKEKYERIQKRMEDLDQEELAGVAYFSMQKIREEDLSSSEWLELVMILANAAENFIELLLQMSDVLLKQQDKTSSYLH